MAKLDIPRLLLSALVCFTLCGSAFAVPDDPPDRPPRFGCLTVKDGLSHPRVHKVSQDNQGFIWIATQRGLNRYDGHRFKHFLKHQTGENALDDDYILDLEFRNDGTFLIGTKRGDFYSFDPRLEHFERYEQDLATASWADDKPRLQIEPGKIWISTKEGLTEIDTSTGQESQPEIVNSHPVLKSDTTNSMIKDQSGNIWIGGTDGLLRLDPESQVSEYLDSVWIWEIFEDSSGRLWVGTIGDGLALFDPQTDTFAHYLSDSLDPQSLTSDLVFSIFEDRDGILWISTDSGVSILEPSRQAFAVFQRDLTHPRAAALQDIVSMERDETQRLWIGTFGEGLIRLDLDRTNPRHFRHDPGTPQSLSHDFVWDLLISGNGDLWIGTETGLDHVSSHQLDLDKPVFDHFQHAQDDPHSLTEGRALSLLEDQQGRLWIGTVYGLSLLEPEPKSTLTPTFRRFVHDPERSDSLAPYQIMALHEDEDGILWLGLDGGGLDRFDTETETFIHYTPDVDDPRTIGGDTVTAIEPGPGGSLWIASFGGGVEQFHPERGEFVDVLPADFPVNPTVSNLLTDSTGAVWFTMGVDAFRFKPETQELTAFNPSDDLITSYSPKSALKMPSGELLWGGREGFASISPQRILSYDQPPLVAITDFRVHDRKIELAAWRSGRVELTHHDRLFWLDFAALHFADSDKNRYRYRMEGLDDVWVDTDASDPKAQFSSLKPASYTFRVQASHKDGVWNEEGATLEIVVLPPPWQTGWAYGLYGLIVGALVWAYIRSQRRQLARERAVSQRLREVDQLKDEFLANTSHELRTPLYGITGLAESLADGATGELPEPTRRNLSMIVASGHRLSRLVGNILDFSKLRHHSLELSRQSIDLHSLVDVVLSLLSSLVDDEILTLSNALDTDLPRVDADENRLQQILYNLLGNAIKFTESGQIEVTADIGEGDHAGHLVVHVRDTGAGIAEAELERIFEPFEQVDSSVERPFGGTGLGLALSRRLVEAHGGTLWASSTLGSGSTFSFSLPISTDEAEGDITSPLPRSLPFTSLEPDQTAPKSGKFPTADIGLPGIEATSENRENQAWRILVVDDEQINRQVLVGHLAARGYTTFTAKKGDEALRQLKDNPIDLVLLDVMMPQMTGYEVCRHIRQHHSLENLPVLFLTARSQTTDRLTGLKVGANDFLIKPVSKDELLARVKTHLDLLDAHRKLEGQVAEKTEEVRILQGLLPICVSCKEIRDDDDNWHQMETYIDHHSEASFSHGLCPSCAKKLYPDIDFEEKSQ